MVAKDVADLFKEYNVLSHVGVDDFSDKLTFLYTLVFNLVAVVIVSSKQYVGGPISCYLPTTLSGANFENYITNYCWVHGTIPLHKNETTPRDIRWDELDKTRRIVYYQWVPFVLCCQAIMAYLPRLFWQMACRSMAGTDLESMMKLADKAVHSHPEERDKVVQRIAENMRDIILDQHRPSQGVLNRFLRMLCCFSSDTQAHPYRLSACLRFAYLGVKCLYLANAILQLYILKYFLGVSSVYFGINVANDLLQGVDWRATMNFPRVTFCYAKGLEILGQTTNFIGQCALPINMLNEKIFIFMWFWYCFVLVVTLLSTMLWFVRIVYARSRMVFMRKYMRFMSQVSRRDDLVWARFTRKFLQGDGVFLVRMIRANAGDMVAQATVERLWSIYSTKYMMKDAPLMKEIKGGAPPNMESDLDAEPLKVLLDTGGSVCRRPTVLASSPKKPSPSS